MNPRYTILQKTLEVPSVEKLRRAFRAVRCLTDADAHTLANDAYGILVKNLAAEDAGPLHQALTTEGIETEIVPQAALPQLPATKFVRRIELGADALLLQDPLGRLFPIEWRHLLLIAAGRVTVTEFSRREPVRPSLTFTPGVAGAPRDLWGNLDLPAPAYREERRPIPMCEIVLSRAVARYSIVVDDAGAAAFAALGAERTRELDADLGALLREFSRRAPQAMLNRGAYLLRENAPERFAYPSKNAFYEEITWMLWQANRP